MKTEKSVAIIYQIVKAKFGATQAQSTISSLMRTIIYDLENEGIVASEESLSEKFSQKANDFISASKSDVA